MTSSAHLPTLQVLRALAAILVLLFHARLAMSHHPDLGAMKIWFQYGFIGVDIFFVLSGFVVGMSAQGLLQGGGLSAFASKRLGRIYLGYWPIFACAVLVWHSGAGKVKLDYGQFWPSLLLIEPHLFSNWLIVAWSLTYELYFYVLIGLAHWLKRPKMMIALFCLGLLLCHVFWRYRMGNAYIHGTPFSFLLSPFCLSFFAGYAVLLVYQQKGADLTWIGLGAVLALLGLSLGTREPLCADVPLYRVATYGVFGLGMLLIALGLHAVWQRPPKWLIALGDSSYSLYLWHTVLLQIGAYCIGLYLPQTSNAMFVLALTLPLICIWWANYWYRIIELPLYRHFLSLFR